MLKSLFPWKHNKTKQVMAARPPMDEELIVQEANLVPCHVCGRTFLPTPLKKHEKICEKNATKKRKPFDSLKQRVAGTDLADFHQPSFLKKKEEPIVEKNPKQSKWKEKHLEFVTAIRAAKGVPSDRMPSSPTPKPRSTTSLIASSAANERCPSCDRHFGPKAFDRHVEWCKERKARIQQSPASVQQAKERLEARIKYRVPALNKSKRTLIREKYSTTNSNPQSPEPVITKSTTSTTNLLGSFSRGPSIRKPKSLVNVEKVSAEPKDKTNRSDIEKCSGDKKRNSTEEDRKMSLSFGLPVIGSPSPKSESVKSLQGKRNSLPSKKLNTLRINDEIQGMTVSSISQVEVNKRMVTWKDTVKKSSSFVEKDSARSDVITPGRKNGRKHSEGLKIPSKVSLEDTNISEKYSREGAQKQNTIKCMKKFVHLPETDINTSRISSINPTNSQKLAKEKTFCLETSFINRNKKLPPKRPREGPTDLSLETKSEMLSTRESAKNEVEKILSSNDVLYKNRLSRIPTKRNSKHLSDALKKYKKAPDKNIDERYDEGEDGKGAEYRINEEIVLKLDDCNNKADIIHESGKQCEKMDSKDYADNRIDDYETLNNNFQEISKKFRCFEGANRETLNLDENLKGVDDLSYSFEDDEENNDSVCKIDRMNLSDGHSDMNEWFKENFLEENLNEDQDEGHISRRHSVLEKIETIEGSCKLQNEEDLKNQNELDRSSEKDSLEETSKIDDNFKLLHDDVEPISVSDIDGSNISGYCDGGSNANKSKHAFSLKTDSSTIDLSPRVNFDKSTNVVYLFQSETNLALTRDNSQNTLTENKSWSSVSTTNFEKELNQISEETFLQETRSSNFSLRKSFSDMNLVNNKSSMNVYQKDELKKDVIPLFFKKRFVFESESVDFRKTCQDIRSISSVPTVHLSRFQFKNEIVPITDACEEVVSDRGTQFTFKHENNNDVAILGQKKVDWADVGSKERLEILRIAAEKFIEETKKDKSKGMVNLASVLEEDYSVPKKKRRVYLSDESETCLDEKILDLNNVNQVAKQEDHLQGSSDGEQGILKTEMEQETVVYKDVSEDCLVKTLSNKERNVPNSGASSGISEMTPRTFNLIEKIVKGKKLRSECSDVLLAVTVSECEKLLDIDRKCLKKVEQKMEKSSGRERVKLPLIIGGKKADSKKDQEIQVGFDKVKDNYVKLPVIGKTRKLSEERKYSKVCQEVKSEDDKKKRLEIQSYSSNYDPFEIAQRQFMELLECDDFKPFTPSDPTKNSSRPHTTTPTPLKTPTTPVPVKKAVKSADTGKKGKRESVIDPPVNFKDSTDSATDNDDFELIENMINERFAEEDEVVCNGNTNGFFLHNLTQNKLDRILDNHKYSDDMSSSIDPRLINENDNLSIPENFKADDYSPTSTVDTEITLQNDDVDHYSVQYDSKIEAIEPKVAKKPLVKRSLSLVNRSKRDANVIVSKTAKTSSNSNSTKKGVVSNKTTAAKPLKNHISSSSSEKPSQNESKNHKSEKKRSLPLLKRSMTLFDPSPKPSFKNKQEVNDYFNGNELRTVSSSMSTSMTTSMEKSMTKSNVQTPLEDTLKAEELFAVDDEMYEEYKKYEEMYLKEKEQNSNSNKKNKNKNVELNYGLLTASEEEDHSNNSNNKLSNDSAYGSLRKTSKHRSRAPKLSPLDPKNAESTSSSGSENGLNSPAPPSSTPKVSKFCHECGTKFPVSTAKFCVECGVKRLVL